MSASQPDRERARLLWQCRRGMAELDALLANFVQRGHADLDAAGKQAFERLLKTPDPLLIEYLLGRVVPADPELAVLARQIRESML